MHKFAAKSSIFPAPKSFSKICKGVGNVRFRANLRSRHLPIDEGPGRLSDTRTRNYPDLKYLNFILLGHWHDKYNINGHSIIFNK